MKSQKKIDYENKSDLSVKKAIELNKNLLMFMEIENKRNEPDNQFSQDNIEALKVAISALELIRSKCEINITQQKESDWLVVRYEPNMRNTEYLQSLFDCIKNEDCKRLIIMPNNISTSIQSVSDLIILFGEAVKKLEDKYE